MSLERRRVGLTIFVATMLACVLVATSVIIGRTTAGGEPTPSTQSAEAGFARDMQVHHNQAVDMSYIVRDRTDDPEVRLLAYDIARSQAQQSGQMFGWLATWGLSQASPDSPMTWMHRPLLSGEAHSSHAETDTAADIPDTMPGMATREQLSQLETLSGVEAERLFLQLMIAHHQGGVAMAESALERSDHPVVTDLASSIVTAQASEIDLMNAMLAARQ